MRPVTVMFLLLKFRSFAEPRIIRDKLKYFIIELIYGMMYKIKICEKLNAEYFCYFG